MNILTNNWIFKKCKKICRKKFRRCYIKDMINCIEIGLNKDNFDKLTKDMIIEKLKKQHPTTYEKIYSNNIEKIERIKEEMFKKHSEILLEVCETFKEELNNKTKFKIF